MNTLNKETLVKGKKYPVTYGNKEIGCLTFIDTVVVSGYKGLKENDTVGFKFKNPEGNEIILTNYAICSKGNKTVFITIYKGYCDGREYEFI